MFCGVTAVVGIGGAISVEVSGVDSAAGVAAGVGCYSGSCGGVSVAGIAGGVEGPGARVVALLMG